VTGFEEVSQLYHRALEMFIQGDPEPVLDLWSTREDATLANPFGPPVRGWEAVRDTGRRAASQVADGQGLNVEVISTYATPDIAFEVEIHRFSARMGGADEAAPVILRVTTIYRREDDDGWRVLHRHADPLPGEATDRADRDPREPFR
jgi:ketosteroid isomerase-like protein